MNRLQEKLHKLRERWKQTRGAVIMEATIVYPVMFFVIFFMLFMGNMFCIRAGIDSLVTQEALTSAAYYADPKLESYSEKEKIPTTLSEAGHVTKNLYRYLDIFDIGGSQSAQSTNLKENIGSYTGYFTGMNPDRIEIVSHKVNNYIIYQTYEVEVKYYLNFPWKFIFHDEKYDIAMTARAEVPVTDSAEFIRNVDLAVDILERTEKGETASENINKTFEKVTAFLNGESRNGGPVSAALVGTGEGEEFGIYAARAKKESGYVDVVIHADPSGKSFTYIENGVARKVEQALIISFPCLLKRLRRGQKSCYQIMQR